MLDIRENESLSKYSTYRIGGPARYFAVAKNKEDIVEAIKFAKSKNLPLFVIGGGSNILFKDKGYDGLIIKILDNKLEIDGEKITVMAGVPLGQLIIESVGASLSGLEWGVGIPGSVGGAVAGNCGAYGHAISESVESVTALFVREDGEYEIKEYKKDACDFYYRHSKFKREGNKEIILEVNLKLEKGDKEEGQKKIKEILGSRAGKFPSAPSAGSFFKNIIINELSNKEEFLKLVPEEKIKGGKFPTAYLVEQCGFKGKQIGGAKFAEEHANFLINTGDAKASDVLELAELCKQKVKEKYGVILEEEVVVV